ncbi:AAA family ATPase [Streptococcus sp. 1001283B150225_161107_H12]|uniref:AAA family ATPase n=1 Tax=Streptococcus sp. 1001283B150225_161107_H12 TaxID=2787122 RepID=UPI00189B9FAD|nr:AAA family ATPase [Streptococcus sp. 1001283B150225_161107_H12]
MKRELTLKLFGPPKVVFQQKDIRFSFSKMEALFYYLAVSGEVNRDEIAGILWGDKENQVARKNLRNTVYQANKIFEGDVIVSPSRSSLALNPELNLSLDVQLFERDPISNLHLYQGDFLEGFYVKDDEDFDQWASRKRSAYKQLYIESCYQKIDKEGLGDPGIESLLHHLVELDEFEEKNYQLLMEYYRVHHQLGKFFETYYKLVDLLDRELNVRPSRVIEELYHSVLEAKRTRKQSNRVNVRELPFFGRKQELSQLEEYLSLVEKGEAVGPLLVMGQSGTGKKRLLRQLVLLSNRSFSFVKLEGKVGSRQEEGGIWDDLKASLEKVSGGLEAPPLGKADNLPAVRKHLQRLSQEKPLLILLENAQWMDAASFNKVKQLEEKSSGERWQLIVTAEGPLPEFLLTFFGSLKVERRLSQLELTNFDPSESRLLLQGQLGQIEPALIEQMMEWSEGSPFLLSSYIEEWKEKESLEPLPDIIQAYLSQELGDLSSEEESLLHYLSCFHKPISMSILADLTATDLSVLTALLDPLTQRGIISIVEEGEDLLVQFCKQLVAMYFYQLLSPARRRLFHQQIAQKLEETLEDSTDLLFYKEIAYQYKQSQNLLRSLSFELTYLEEILQLEHELFPIYSKGEEGGVSDGKNSHLDIFGELSRLRRELDQLFSRHQKDRDYKYLQLRYLYLEGRYFIRSGEYQKGIHDIQKVISYARELKQLDFLLEGYRQIIYYCIQTENISEMAYYTDLALEDAIQANNHEAIAIQLRLKGLYHLMVGDEEQATRHLYRSIDCFSLTNSMQAKYAIQIAASLAYLAEIEQVRGHFQVAVTHLEEVLRLVGDQSVDSVRVVFEIDLGIAYYWKGDLVQARLYFDRAQKVLSSVRFPWKEELLEFYQALIACHFGEQEKVAHYLARKEGTIKQATHSRDKGMVYYLLAFLSAQKEQGEHLNPPLSIFLREDKNYYKKLAEQHLTPYRDRPFLKRLKVL